MWKLDQESLATRRNPIISPLLHCQIAHHKARFHRVMQGRAAEMCQTDHEAVAGYLAAIITGYMTFFMGMAHSTPTGYSLYFWVYGTFYRVWYILLGMAKLPGMAHFTGYGTFYWAWQNYRVWHIILDMAHFTGYGTL